MPRITRREGTAHVPSPEIADQLGRAGRSIATAQIDLENEDADGAASRAYYAAFHAATALFLREGKSFKTHSALEQTIHKDIVHAGRWPEDLGRRYKYLVNLRSTADCGAMQHVSGEEAARAIQYAKLIVDVVRRSMA